MIAVDFLKNHAECVETVAGWIFDEWDHVIDPDPAGSVARVRGRLNDDRVPLALVALESGACVGTISLYEDDLSSRPDLTPWLAALYVHPAHRSRGVGGRLMDELIAVSRRLGIERLYLHTETAADYYRARGWRFLFATVNDRGEQTEVFDRFI